MTKAQILKQTGLTEQEFYKLYPTQQHYQMAMGGRLYANGGGLPPDEGTSYVQYDEAGNPITANQMYSNKNSLNLRDVTSSPTTENWTQENENSKLEDLQSLKRQKEALEYNLQNSQNEVSKSRIKDELNAVNDKINHWETYGVSKPKEGLYYESNDGMNYSELGMRNEGMHYSEKDVPESFDDMSFNSAFGAARKQGLKKFTWKGKSYGTNLKGESTKSSGKIPPPVVSEIKGAPRRMADGGGIGDEEPRPVVHTGTANNKSLFRQGLDYFGNLGVQDFSNNIQDIFFNPNKGVILERNNPNISSIIPAVKNYNSSNIKPSYTQQYADGGNLAGNMGMTGIQNNDVKANNKYFTDAEAALAAFAENMPIVGSIVKAQNNRLSGAREQIDKKGGIGAGAGQAFSQAVDIGLSAIGGPKLSGGKSTDSSYAPKDVTKQLNTSPTQNLAWETNNNGGLGMPQNNTLIDPNTTDPNSYVTPELYPNAYGGRLNYGFGGSTDGRTPQYTKTAASALSHNPYMSNVSPVIAGGAGSVNRVGQASNNILGQASPIHKSNTGAYYTDKNINVNSYTKAAGGAITEINTGGTHEQNPMGGVMVGRNASVEQGEALINKDGKPAFVLTDRIKLDSTTAEEFGLPKKYIGKTFSDIGKAENRVSDLRPNDPLTKDLLKSRNEKLEAAQEAQKARMAEKHMAKAQELAPEMFQQAQPQGMPQEQMAMQDPAMEQQMMAMQGQGMPQGMPQQPMMASGGSLNFKSSGAYNKWLGYVHANKLAENTLGHQKVSIGGEPHRVQHGYGGVMQYAYGDPIEPVKMEPVMMNTNVYPTIPYPIQNVSMISDPNALRDLQQRDRSIDATLNWEKNNGYNNYGFTSEPAGSINSLGQAHEKFMDNYQPMIDDLPIGLQGLVADFAFNSEDPKASLMVSQGYLTPEEKIKLYKNGKLDNTAVNNLWKIHGKNVINDFNTDRVAFANNFDAERLRSYKNTKGADEKLPEWTRRVADSRNASGIPLTNPLITLDKLKKSPREFEGVPPVFGENPPGKQELKDILLSDTKIPKDRTGLKAAILGTQAAMEAARLASTKKPVDFRNVQYTQVNPYTSQAIMQANKNNDIANYRDVLRNAGASQAQYIGNATQTFPAMSADYASKIAMLRYQADQANNQIANTEEQTNQAIQAQNIERRAQGEANLSNQLGNIGAGLVQNTLPIITEKEKRDMQLATIGLMDTSQYKYVIDENTGRLQKFFRPTEKGIQNTTAKIETDKEGNKYLWNTTTGTWEPIKTGAYGGKITKKKFGGSMKNC